MWNLCQRLVRCLLGFSFLLSTNYFLVFLILSGVIRLVGCHQWNVSRSDPLPLLGKAVKNCSTICFFPCSVDWMWIWSHILEMAKSWSYWLSEILHALEPFLPTVGGPFCTLAQVNSHQLTFILSVLQDLRVVYYTANIIYPD